MSGIIQTPRAEPYANPPRQLDAIGQIRKVFLQLNAVGVQEWFMGLREHHYIGLERALSEFVSNPSNGYMFNGDFEHVYDKLEPVCDERCGRSCYLEENKHFLLELTRGAKDILDIEREERLHDIVRSCRLSRDELNYFLPTWFPRPS